MLQREIIAVCFEVHKQHINTTLYGQNAEFISFKILWYMRIQNFFSLGGGGGLRIYTTHV
jgi:hypothetical protein